MEKEERILTKSITCLPSYLQIPYFDGACLDQAVFRLSVLSGCTGDPRNKLKHYLRVWLMQCLVLRNVFLTCSFLGEQFLEMAKEWSVSDEAMPTLCQLEIVWCEKLRMIPDGLRFITTLQQLEIQLMPFAFRKRVRAVNGEGGEDSYKVQHVPSIIIY